MEFRISRVTGQGNVLVASEEASQYKNCRAEKKSS